MESIKFTITNNAWINNGLVRLIHELEKHFYNEVLIERNDNSVILFSNTNKDILYYLTEVIHFLASDGTYNYAQVFKLINKFLNGSYSPSYSFPKEKGDGKITKKIPKEYIKKLKIHDKRSFKTSEQIWKMRLSYLGKEKHYIEFGLNFESSEFCKKLENNEYKKNICPNCGNISKNMIDVKQFFNPLLNEHHNNQIEGFSTNFRKKSKLCPNCAILAIISLFDKYIPFFKQGKDDTILALPNVCDLNILEKIINNLSLDSQFYNFNNPEITHYNTNILNFNNNSKYGALLSLLHNIQNNFSKEEVDDIFSFFTSNELMNLVDWIFITDSFKITRVTANQEVYKILKVQKDPNYGIDIYLVNDFFNNINFNNFSPYQIDKFFNSFLTLNHELISQSLFDMVKSDIGFKDKSTIYLFKEIFLNQIMEEILMLDDDFKNASKSIAETIGRAFFKDIGLLSKFAYATDEIVFKECVEEAFFLMAKKSALDSNKEYYSNGKELIIFFDGLNKDNFKETKSYFVSFMSSGALYEKFLQKQKKP